MTKYDLMGLGKGSYVKLTSGEIVEYIEVKTKNFTGKLNEKLYNIPIEMVERLATEQEIKDREFLNLRRKPIVDRQDNTDIFKKLKKGDYFYINAGRNNDATLFIYESMTDKKVIGINPITQAKTRIDKTFNFYMI